MIKYQVIIKLSVRNTAPNGVKKSLFQISRVALFPGHLLLHFLDCICDLSIGTMQSKVGRRPGTIRTSTNYKEDMIIMCMD